MNYNVSPGYRRSVLLVKGATATRARLRFAASLRIMTSGQSAGASQQAGKKWADEHKEKIALFYLSGYSPELNPGEQLNADLKHAICSKVPVHTKARRKEVAIKHMLILEQSPERVKKYFQDPYVKYAA
ncbi:MAG: hypothetical protein J0H48_06975 [Nitrosospira multiformis]|nr:hypothetical protein [Nitrosospira multiformis]